MKKGTFWACYLIGLLMFGALGLFINDMYIEGRLKNWERNSLQDFEPDATIHERLSDGFALQTTAVLIGEAEKAPYNQLQSRVAYLLPERLDSSKGCLVLDIGDQVRYSIALSNLSDTEREIECVIDFGQQQTILRNDHVATEDGGSESGELKFTIVAGDEITFVDQASDEVSGDLTEHWATVRATLPAGGQVRFTVATELTSSLKASPLRAQLPVEMSIQSDELEAAGEIYCLETVSFWGRLGLLAMIVSCVAILSLVLAAAVSSPRIDPDEN